MNQLQRTSKTQLSLLLVSVCLTGCTGCFDAEHLIESRRLIAIRARLVEIDLGDYRVTLPQTRSLHESTEIRFHVFGQVANHDLESVEDILDARGPEIRDKMIAVIRGLAPDQLEDPELIALKKGIADVVNNTLDEEPVQSVGFYNFRYSLF